MSFLPAGSSARQTCGLLKAPISRDLGWTNTDFANVHLCFQAAYAASFLVWGRLADRLGSRPVLAIAFGIWSVNRARKLTMLVCALAVIHLLSPRPIPAAAEASG